MNPFKKIYGIGPKLADELFEKYNKKEDIYNFLKKNKDKLSEQTLNYIKYKPAINFPRKLAKSIDFGIGVICGSYRREKPFIGDIDILLKSADEYKQLSAKLNLIPKPLAEGPEIIRTLARIDKIYVQIDFFILPEGANYYTYLLYLTGSKEFNIFIRSIAAKKGFKLNQNGLFGQKKEINSEKDIFDILGLEYKEPKERN